MDWLLKGGLYIVSYNKFYGYANIHDYVVGNFRNGCLRSYKVQKREGPLEGDSIFTTGFIDYYSHNVVPPPLIVCIVAMLCYLF